MPEGRRRWWLDNVNIDTCAFAIKNRSAGWSMASRRGDNYFVPGRDGSVWNSNKPYDENQIVLSMFAAGAEPDGSWPRDEDKRIKVRENLDTLSRVFGKNRLMELVFTERDDYNRINMIPNPAAESANSKALLRENVIQNPSGDYSSGRVTARFNLSDNPGMEAAAKESVFRINMVRNPRMAAEGSAVVNLRNRALNPSVESGTRFWVAATNANVDQSNRTRARGTWPVQGKRSLRVRAKAKGNCAAELTSIPVAESTAHNFSVYVWNKALKNRVFRLRVYWYNKNGKLIKQSNNDSQTVGTDAVARLSANFSAPANAKTATLRIIMVGADDVDVFFCDAAMVVSSANLYDYFDGDSDEQDGYRFRWADEPGRSKSERYYVPPRGYASNEILRLSTERARLGSQSAMVVMSSSARPTGHIIFNQSVSGGCGIGAGKWVSGLISARMGDTGGSAYVERVLNPDFQTDVNGWVGNNVTLSWDPEGRARAIISSVAADSFPNMRISNATTNRPTVAANRRYRFSANVEPEGGGLTTFNARIVWLNAANAVISNTDGVAVTADPGGSANVVVTGIAPVGAVRADVQVGPTNPAETDVGDSFFLDEASFMEIRTVTVNLGCYNSQGTYLGVVKDATDTDVPDVALELDEGTWKEVTFESGLTLPGTSTVCLFVRLGEPWLAGDQVYFDTCMVEPSQRLGDYFDGGIADDDTFTYDWADFDEQQAAINALLSMNPFGSALKKNAGSPQWSTSTCSGQTVLGWVAQDGYQFQSSDGMVRDYAMELQAYRNPKSTDRPRVFSKPLSAFPGRKHTLSAWVKPSRTTNFKVGVSTDVGASYTYGASVSCASGIWTRVSLSGVLVPAGTSPDNVRIVVTTDAAPVDNDQHEIDAVLFEPVSDLRPYFDGDNPNGEYAWLATKDRSESWWLQPRANGWATTGAVVAYQATEGTNKVVRAVADEDTDMTFTFGQDGIDFEMSYSFGVNLKTQTAKTGSVGITWMDSRGFVVDVTETPIAATTSSSYTRYAITETPPEGAVVAAPFIKVNGLTAGQWVQADQAIFGFGDDTDFKDGNSGGGWQWVDESFDSGDVFSIVADDPKRRWASESVQLGPGVDFWLGVNGTLQRTSAWSSNRNYSAVYEAMGSSGGSSVKLMAAGSDDQSRFTVKDRPVVFDAGEVTSITFSITVNPLVNMQVRLRLAFYKWTGQGWVAASGATPLETVKEPITAGVPERLVLSGDLSMHAGDATHFMPFVDFFSAAGGNLTIGDRVYLDAASLTRDTDPTYQDGETDFVRWDGAPNMSESRRVGPGARRIFVERVNAIDFTDLGHGVLAEFAAQLRAPYVFWEETKERTQRLVFSRNGSTLRFDEFEGTTAPINDSVIRVYGPIKDFQLTDEGSGEWIRVDTELKAGQWVEINSSEWTVKNMSGKSIISTVVHSGGGTLFPVTVPNNDNAPRIMINADSIGVGSYMTLTGREKYQIA